MANTRKRSALARAGRGRRLEWWAGLCLGIVLACAAGCTPAEEPLAEPPRDWETFNDPGRGIAFGYPRDLGTAYIHAVDWPPQVNVEDGPFTCREAGEETARAGRTESRTIGGRTYCVTRVTEGAAGSVYTLHAYAMPVADDVVILTFSLRAVQCGNYDEPQRAECERERAAFSIDPVVDAIARSITVKGN